MGMDIPIIFQKDGIESELDGLIFRWQENKFCLIVLSKRKFVDIAFCSDHQIKATEVDSLSLGLYGLLLE